MGKERWRWQAQNRGEFGKYQVRYRGLFINNWIAIRSRRFCLNKWTIFIIIHDLNRGFMQNMFRLGRDDPLPVAGNGECRACRDLQCRCSWWRAIFLRGCLWEVGGGSEVPDCNGRVSAPPLIRPLELTADIGRWWESPHSVTMKGNSGDYLYCQPHLPPPSITSISFPPSEKSPAANVWIYARPFIAAGRC